MAAQIFRKTDFLWLLFYPVYQVIGTIRHEGSHAIAAQLEGARITEFVYVPSMLEGHGFLWGYVSFDGPTTWLSLAAPYFADLLTFAVFFVICLWLRRLPHWIWLNLLIIGLASPLFNSVYAYQGGFWRPGNDVARILADVPNFPVHLYFILTIGIYIVGIIAIIRYVRRPVRQSPDASLREVGRLPAD